LSGIVQKVKSKITLEFPKKKDERKWFTFSKEFECHCVKEICWITQSGDFYPYVFFGNSFRAENIRNEKFLDLWAKSKNMIKLLGHFYTKMFVEEKLPNITTIMFNKNVWVYVTKKCNLACPYGLTFIKQNF